MNEEIANKVAASVRSITSEQVERIIELKQANPDLGYREIGKRVGLKKDKVMQAWKMAEPMLAMAKEIPKEPERPRDEGEFYSEAFSMIERFLKRGLKPADIVIELVKGFKILPEKANAAVRSYFEQKRLSVIDLERKWGGKLRVLSRKVDELRADIELLQQEVELGLGSPGRYQREECIYFRKSDGVCTHWSWSNLPSDPLIRASLVRDKGNWRLKVSEHPEHCATCMYRQMADMDELKRIKEDLGDLKEKVRSILDVAAMFRSNCAHYLPVWGICLEFRAKLGPNSAICLACRRFSPRS